MVVPTETPLINTSTVELASAVPLNSSVLSEVIPSVAPVSSEIVVTAGALGVPVSTVTDNGVEAVDVFPDNQ